MTEATADRQEPAGAEPESALDPTAADRQEPAPAEPEAVLDPIPAEPESTLDAVRHAAIDLLDALEDRPERLRVQSAGVTVDLDWRTETSRAAGRPDGSWPAAGPPDGMLAQPADAAPVAVAVTVAPLALAAAAVLQYVCSPSVGAFYRAPEPGSAPFAPAGAAVRVGQQVAIIEVMKLMLPVESEHAGRVVEVLVKDGQTVEYGERLLALEPLGAE